MSDNDPLKNKKFGSPEDFNPSLANFGDFNVDPNMLAQIQESQKQMNSMQQHEKFEPPTTEEMMQHMSSAQMFNENDLMAGYSNPDETGFIGNYAKNGNSADLFSSPFGAYPNVGDGQSPTPDYYSMDHPAADPSAAKPAGDSLELYENMAVNASAFGLQPTPDAKLRPGAMNSEQLQKELELRGMPVAENDRATNLGRLVNYMLDRNFGESDLSSDDEAGQMVPSEAPVSGRRIYSFLEVILISCDMQRRALLEWLESWKNAARDSHDVDIFELSENQIIKIRIFSKFKESSGVIPQLKSVKIKCARYYAFSRGDTWGGWEFYMDGEKEKEEVYSAENPPPFFWKRLCWLENLNGLGDDADVLKLGRLKSEQICSMLGTEESMICVDCGNDEKMCSGVHGNFNGHFKSKDLYSRYASLIGE